MRRLSKLHTLNSNIDLCKFAILGSDNGSLAPHLTNNITDGIAGINSLKNLWGLKFFIVDKSLMLISICFICGVKGYWLNIVLRLLKLGRTVTTTFDCLIVHLLRSGLIVISSFGCPIVILLIPGLMEVAIKLWLLSMLWLLFPDLMLWHLFCSINTKIPKA